VKKRLIVVFFLVLLTGVGGLVYLGQQKERTRQPYYSGTIEATQANLAFQTAGRVRNVLTDEGRTVKTGQLLAELEADELSARVDQARANLNRAVETRKQLEAVLRLNRAVLPAEADRADAAVRALRFQMEEVESGFRSQEVERGRLSVQKAEAALEEARKNKARFDALYEKRAVAERDKDTADLRHQTALKEYERARESFDLLREGSRQETVNAARARLAEGQAALRQARGNLQRVEVSERDVEVGATQVEGAESALKLAEIQLSYTRLVAPFDGILTSRNIEPGEVVTPGREVLSLADLSQVDLKVYVEETEIGKVKPDQAVKVKTDTFSQKAYAGRVSFISPEAEFTPKVIQTQKERVKLVFLVKVEIPNPDLELKPGMPADAWFME
jgi:HlyD family secretion protein